MRWVAATLYGLAAAHGAGLLLDALGTGICVGLASLAALYAIDAMIQDGRRTDR